MSVLGGLSSLSRVRAQDAGPDPLGEGIEMLQIGVQLKACAPTPATAPQEQFSALACPPSLQDGFRDSHRMQSLEAVYRAFRVKSVSCLHEI